MERVAVLLFGGRGTRFGENKPKQFVLLGEHPLCYYAASSLNASEHIDKIVAVSDKGSINELSAILYGKHQFGKVKAVIPGGSTRQESVYLALKYLKNQGESPDSLVLIQDGDRPNLTPALIKENVETAQTYGASVTAIPATDSLLYAEDNEAGEYLKRDKVYQVQTPQCFRFDWIYKAHTLAKNRGLSFTDDASTLPLIGKSAHLVLGSKDNLKITTTIDAEIFLKENNHET